MSKLVEETIGDDDEEIEDDSEVPLPNVSTPVLEKVLEYCKHYQEEPMTAIQTPLKSSKLEELVQPWYAEFVKVPRALLFDLVAAANFMDIKSLLDLTCLAVSILIKGKSAAELREMFNIGVYSSPSPCRVPTIARRSSHSSLFLILSWFPLCFWQPATMPKTIRPRRLPLRKILLHILVDDERLLCWCMRV